MIRKLFLFFPVLLVFFSVHAASAYASIVEEGTYKASYIGAAVVAQLEKEQFQTATAAQDITLDVPAPITYEVNTGDTLTKISRSFGISIGEIVAFNGISNPNRLYIGQKIEIPVLPKSLPALKGKQPVIKKVLTSTLTAYTAGVESTGKTPSHPQYGITYSGVKAAEGRTIAVDPKVIPLGSTVFIEGIGLRKAEDTGSAIRGPKIDVFMNDVDQALDFGVKKNVKVYVLGAV